MNKKNVLTVKNLNKVYSKNGSKQTHALNNLNLEVKEGEIFGLLGPNGAGKSTFINILGGSVVKTGGEVNVWGFNLDKNPRQVRASIGIVPQEVNFDPFFSPRKLLELQAGLYGIREKDRITDTILKLVSLEEQADSYARALSGGMKRRLLVAKAMVHQPPIIILDEPTAGVDVELRNTLWENVKSLNKQGVTTILTTHYLEEAEKMCDRIGILSGGKLVALDTTKNLLERIQTKIVYVTTDKKTYIEDNTFEDIKAVHSLDGLENGASISTSFAANTVLSTTKKVFPESIEFNITGGNTLASPQVADFRSQLKVGDIITYGAAGNSIPTFSRVTAVTQNDVTIAGVPGVVGVCTGLVTNTSGTNPLSGINVVIPTLNESDNPGLRVRLANDYVASMNVLDSSYITRKQFGQTATGNSVQFGISGLGGDTSELFFELFSAANYYLEVDNVHIPLFESQVSVNDTLKSVTISGIPNGSAELTVAVRRSKLVSKEKSLTRCNLSLIHI